MLTAGFAAERVIAGTRSIGMSLDTCTVPGSTKENRIVPGMAELELGIHGEPRVQKIGFASAEQAMAAMVDKLAPTIQDTPHVALLNNLGGAGRWPPHCNCRRAEGGQLPRHPAQGQSRAHGLHS